jgi:putative membrane protein
MRISTRLSLVAGLLVAASAAHAQSQAGKAATAPALDDPTIVAIFDAANTFDMETGALAAKKGSTQAVRDLGKQLSGDHNMVRQQGRDLATHLHVTPTPP